MNQLQIMFRLPHCLNFKFFLANKEFFTPSKYRWFVKKITVMSLILISWLPQQAQNILQDGFDYLNKGEFAEAEYFFNQFLIEHPEDKTAQICYGRATGLNGNPKQAIDLFLQLKAKEPTNLEIRLNLAEAFLWDNQKEQAIDAYLFIISHNPDNFVANLGLANAYSSNKKTLKAYKQIRKTKLIDPQNPSLKQSFKFISLARIDQLRNHDSSSYTLELLIPLEKEYAEDKDVIISKAISYLHLKSFKKALIEYRKLLSQNNYLFEALLGASYSCMLLGKKTAAISYAADAYQHIDKQDTSDYIRALTHDINVLASGQKWRILKERLNDLIEIDPENKEVKMTIANVEFWRGNWNHSNLLFEQQSRIQPDHANLKVAYSGLLNAMNRKSQAIEELKKAVKLDPHNPDSRYILKKWLNEDKAYLKITGTSFWDNGGTLRNGIIANYTFKRMKSWIPYLEFNYFNVTNKNTNISTKYSKFRIGFQHLTSAKIELGSFIGVSVDNLNKSIALWSNSFLSYKIHPRHTIRLDFIQDEHNYSLDLVKKEISTSDLQAHYFYTSKVGIGFYGQYSRTFQNDKNSRNLFFLSGYYNIMNKPVLQVGINYFNMSFKKFSRLYFSPQSFQSQEIFIKIDNGAVQHKKVIYKAMIAFGNQDIEKEISNQTVRFDLMAGLRFSSASTITIDYTRSTSAISSTTGFSSYQIMLNYIQTF